MHIYIGICISNKCVYLQYILNRLPLIFSLFVRRK